MDFKNFSVSVLLQNYIAKSGAIDVNQSSLVKLNQISVEFHLFEKHPFIFTV